MSQSIPFIDENLVLDTIDSLDIFDTLCNPNSIVYNSRVYSRLTMQQTESIGYM